MSLTDLVRIVRRRIVWVIGVTLLGALAGLAAASLLPKTYEAHTSLYVTSTDSRDAAALSQGAEYVQSQIRSYPLIVTAPAVLAAVSRDTGVPPAELASQVSAAVPTDSAVLDITTTARDAEAAATTASSFARNFGAEIQRIETRAGGQSPIRVSTIQPATPPTSPVAPNVRIYLLIGLMLGLVLGLLAAVVRDLMSRS
ncbi:YveK family protein [Agilicoccus flavus]|uniref:YveK family protein n=1 Tax=Agilicoccus flavus TaxID=2775968 RepID=UPI001CF6B68A|nr:Wzz/FepE/Etk N-terminal domain-containing protein [Agilicoccus flavus]